LNIDNKRVLLARLRTWVGADVELHLPDPQVVAAQTVLLDPRILFVDPGFVCLIERLLLLFQRLALAARAERVELICRQNDSVDSPVLLDEFLLFPLESFRVCVF